MTTETLSHPEALALVDSLAGLRRHRAEEVARLRATLAALYEDREDAARYRRLRNPPDGMLCVRADRHNGLNNVRMIGDELDTAIDRARGQGEGR